MAERSNKPSRDVVVVTGASGLIGSAVVKALVARFQVIGFDRAGNANPPPEAECVCVDITSDTSVHDGLARVRYAYGSRIASVVHLAAYYSFSGEPSPMYDEVAVQGTKRLLHALRDFDVEQFVFSSTMLVHAPSPPRGKITEDSPVEPKWAYPESKVKTEQLIHDDRAAAFRRCCCESPVCTMTVATPYRSPTTFSVYTSAGSPAISFPATLLRDVSHSCTSTTWSMLSPK